MNSSSDKYLALKDELKSLKGIDLINAQNDYSWDNARMRTFESYLISVEALEESEIIQYEKGIADALRTQGLCLRLQGDYTATIECCERAMEIYKKLKLESGKAEILYLIGSVYSEMGDLKNANTKFNESLEIRIKIGNPVAIVQSMNALGDWHMRSKRYEEALNIFQECLNIEHDNEMYRGIVLYNVAETNFLLGNLSLATHHIEACAKIGKELDFPLMSVYSLWLKGRIAREENNLNLSIKLLNESLDKARSINVKERVFHILQDLSESFEKLGDLSSALRTYKEYHEVKEEVLNETSAEKIRSIEYRYEIGKVRAESKLVQDRNIALERAYEQIEIQSNEIAHQNNEIKASIRYAERLQKAILPSQQLVDKLIPDSFIMYKPKDILSGDFYWLTKVKTHDNKTRTLVALADCTGHGIPGALMSIIGNNFLRSCEHNHEVNKPAEALDFINAGVFTTLRNKSSKNVQEFDQMVMDGMDMTMFAFDFEENVLEYATARHQFLLIRNGEISSYKGDNHSIGFLGNDLVPFNNYSIKIEKGDLLYMFSDGYSDQFGGPNYRKLKLKYFKDLLLKNAHLSMKLQQHALEIFLEEWTGSGEQMDDICVIGIRV